MNPTRAAIRPYIELARVDHWFKNSFMVLGVVLAMFYERSVLTWSLAPQLLAAVLATCFVASGNYVLNELLDAPTDAAHPQKRNRPAASGRISRPVAYAEWIALASLGLFIASRVGTSFALSAAALAVMGVIYNVPPIRTKEWPYLDVLTEAVNNPIRLLLGWFALIPHTVPPVSLLIAYWMAGAFFMAVKRYAEYRHIGDPAIAAAYRRSFGYYTENRLLVSVMFYATACALFSGIFIVRYHLELILVAPLVAGLFAQYLKLGLLPDSPAQRPERLYRTPSFVAYVALCVVVFVVLMFTEIPPLYDWFNVEPSASSPLWRIQ